MRPEELAEVSFGGGGAAMRGRANEVVKRVRTREVKEKNRSDQQSGDGVISNILDNAMLSLTCC